MYQKKEGRLASMPLYHMAVMPTVYFSVLRSGFKVFLMCRFTLKKSLRNIVRHQIMVWYCWGSTIKARPSEVSQGIVGGGSSFCIGMGDDKFVASGTYVGTELLTSYKEITCFVTIFLYPLDDDTASVGYSLPGIYLKLSSEAILTLLTLLDPNKPVYERIISADWKTDEFFYMLVDGILWTVVPPELENVLLFYPLIVDAAVVGTEALDNCGECATELPRVYVVRSFLCLRDEEVKIYLAQRPAKYKCL
ncbi:hypothetical protein N7481_006846 [Penicillium waksmanii]|uniref:uncharacterized protein n=1 Tax=Penicillium waksmanii TaxID=69791 RepID=UPI0025477312|nr:uncharacterized protein N7481_006846 [Penicillium waksmanii]KAJ5979548.1 hypothetical protein N7481_006846 [Penicillium waksmanii]